MDDGEEQSVNDDTFKAMKKILLLVGCLQMLGNADIQIDSSGAVKIEPLNTVLLAGYNEQIKETPQFYKKRYYRAYLILRHGSYAPPVQEDIDTLLGHSDWHDQGERLEALSLYFQGRLDEAKSLIQRNIRGNICEHEQASVWAAIELSHKDTAAALGAYRSTWNLFKDENVYMDLLDLYRADNKPVPQDVLREGLRVYPRSPGATQATFEAYFRAGDSASLRKCAAVSAKAEKMLWPQSVDWKIRHAQTLLALHRKKEAETVLLAALDLADADPRQEQAGKPLRAEIFTLLEIARK